MLNNQITAINRWLQLKHSFSFQCGNFIKTFFQKCERIFQKYWFCFLTFSSLKPIWLKFYEELQCIVGKIKLRITDSTEEMIIPALWGHWGKISLSYLSVLWKKVWYDPFLNIIKCFSSSYTKTSWLCSVKFYYEGHTGHNLNKFSHLGSWVNKTILTVISKKKKVQGLTWRTKLRFDAYFQPKTL